MMRRPAVPALTLLCLILLAGSAWADTLPRPDHVVIVVEENRAYEQVVGNAEAPYINALAKRGTLFTRSYGVTHPSQPNYLALFSGSTHGYNSNACPLFLSGDNMASLLRDKGLSFAIYAESLPTRGNLTCGDGPYRRKHIPAANWIGLQNVLLPFRDFPGDFDALPAVAWVVPDQRHDMHDGSIADADAWLKTKMDAYAQWAETHNSLLIVTWDEDDGAHNNRVLTFFVGAMVKRGISAQRINHYNVLRTVEQMFGLDYAGESAKAEAITGVWRTPARTKK